MESGRGCEDGRKSREDGTLTLKIGGLGQELRLAGSLWELEKAPQGTFLKRTQSCHLLDFSLLRLEISITVKSNVLL